MTDFLLVAWVSALIEIRRFGWMFGLGERWTPGQKLKLLFAGYNGNINENSDDYDNSSNKSPVYF